MVIAIRLPNEIPLDELGKSCIFCGHLVASFTGFFLGGAARSGLELPVHDRCAADLKPDQLASAAAMRTLEQLVRGFYEKNNHGPMFARAMKEMEH